MKACVHLPQVDPELRVGDTKPPLVLHVDTSRAEAFEAHSVESWRRCWWR